MSATIWQVAGARLPWLVGLMLLQSISSAILASFQVLISKQVVLALFLTMVIGTAGNAGNQASTAVIRAIGTGEVSPRKDGFAVLSREIFVSLVLATSVGLVAFSRVAWTPGASRAAAIAVSTSLFCTTLVACVIGAAAPLLFDILGLDPVNSTGPALATLTDISGVLILCLLAYIIFSQLQVGV